MFQYDGIAGHHGWCRAPQDLPEGEVPGHDHVDHTQWLKGDKALPVLCFDVPVSQVVLRLNCIVFANPCALLYLHLALADWFAHFVRDQPGIGGLSLPEQ